MYVYEYKWILKVLDRLMDTWTKGKSYLSKLGGECMLSDIAMVGIRKGPICAKRYTFMLTNPTYEVSFGFTNIYGLALST